MEIRLDRSLCMGSGNCSYWASGVFDLDHEGLVVVIDPAGAADERVRLAAQSCPTGAIIIDDVDPPLSAVVGGGT